MKKIIAVIGLLIIVAFFGVLAGKFIKSANSLFSWVFMFQPLRVIYGLVLVAILIFPFGLYYSRSEPYIMGNLWGYNLPIGYVGLISGLLVIFYQKISLMKNFRFGSFMILIGILLIVSFLFSPKDFFVNLLHGTNFSSGQIDIEYPIGNSFVLGLSLFSIITGLLLRFPRNARLPDIGKKIDTYSK